MDSPARSTGYSFSAPRALFISQHPEDRLRASIAWRVAVEGKAPYDLGYRVFRHDGVYGWLKASTATAYKCVLGNPRSRPPIPSAVMHPKSLPARSILLVIPS
ncbi:MAG: hypothetical protein C4519_04665 [Desulfobacteraceae bacterium]|nr:MAG: hypothetical protein C4519_04665 [Desulfobacteraceae bacterium]